MRLANSNRQKQIVYYDELQSRPVDITCSHQLVGKQAYLGFEIEPFGVSETMDWGNTPVHNFIDERFDYIEIIADSLARVLGQKTEGGQTRSIRVPIKANAKTRHLAGDLFENNYPCDFRPLPTQDEFNWHHQISQTALATFLGETLDH